MDVKPATWTEFKADLGASLKAWRVAPLLPLIAVALAATSYVREPWWWLALPVLVLGIGWLGTERIWYLRVYRNEPVSARELWRMTWAFFGRFLRLGILAGIAWSPVLIVALLRVNGDPGDTDRLLSSPGVWITTAVVTIVIDFALTFVTAALAYSTRRVREALRLGFRMLREHWPRTAWYAAVPPLAVVLILRVTESSTSTGPGHVALSVVAALLNLWFKGATAAFYLRRVDVGPEGAAFIRDLESSAALGRL